jgi:hypothetical protein
MELTFKQQMQKCEEIAQQINEANDTSIDASDVWRATFGTQYVIPIESKINAEIAKRKAYINGLKKFWHKKLNHIKKPTQRKRKIVDRYVFATMAVHKRNGVPHKSKTI